LVAHLLSIMRLRWAGSIWWLAALACGLAPAVTAAPAPTLTAKVPASPDAIYAAFTVNLTRFVTWPAAAMPADDSPLLIGTFPRDPINRELDAAVQGEAINGHPLQTYRLRTLDDVRRCQVVFVSRGVANPAAVLARVGHRPILTISDVDDFLALGGHVLFVPRPPHIGLQISAVNLRASGLEARSQLLRIAATP
jgi:hypothetical protein